MPDELYTFSHTELETHGMKDVWVSAGFTLDEVRRLAIALLDYDDHGYLHEELAPFAHLLKEKNDAQ